jgi:hypothetical protein
MRSPCGAGRTLHRESAYTTFVSTAPAQGKTTVAAHLARHCVWDTLPVLHPAAANENKAAAQSKTHYAFVTTPTQHPAADKNGYNGCTIEIALRPYILALCVEDY